MRWLRKAENALTRRSEVCFPSPTHTGISYPAAEFLLVFTALRLICLKIYCLQSSQCGSFPGLMQSHFIHIADYNVSGICLYI